MVVVLNFLAVWFVFMCRLKLTKVSKEFFGDMPMCGEEFERKKQRVIHSLSFQ